MTLDEMKIKAREISDEIDDILSGMTPQEFPGQAVNWADLSCVAVGVALTDDPISWEATIEEASPGCARFASHIHDELRRRGYPDVWIRTEW
jgi:hypothetical protein